MQLELSEIKSQPPLAWGFNMNKSQSWKIKKIFFSYTLELWTNEIGAYCKYTHRD